MEIVHIGIKGRVVALDAATGEQLWETPLKGSSFTNLVLEGNRIYAATRGELWCLDASSGQILWTNGLSGMGYGYVAFAKSGNVEAIAQLHADEQARRASSGGTGAGAL